MTEEIGDSYDGVLINDWEGLVDELDPWEALPGEESMVSNLDENVYPIKKRLEGFHQGDSRPVTFEYTIGSIAVEYGNERYLNLWKIVSENCEPFYFLHSAQSASFQSIPKVWGGRDRVYATFCKDGDVVTFRVQLRSEHAVIMEDYSTTIEPESVFSDEEIEENPYLSDCMNWASPEEGEGQ